MPSSSTITVIPGSVLSPITTTIARIANEETDERTFVNASVYPNPFEDRLTVVLGQLTGKVTVSVYDLVGQQYYEKEYQVIAEQADLEIDLTATKLKPGLYLLKLKSVQGGISVFKVLKN